MDDGIWDRPPPAAGSDLVEALNRALRSTSSVTTAAQAVSSLRNVLFFVLAARGLSSDEFGQVAIVTIAAITLNELLRAAGSHPLALLFDKHSVEDERPLERALSFQFALAATTGTVLAVLATPIEPALALGALAYIAVAGFDGLRTGSINRGRPDRALALDLAWSATLLPLLLIIMTVAPSASSAIAVWGGTSAATVIVGIARSSIRPSHRLAVPFWREVRTTARSLTTQVGLEAIPTRIGGLLIAAIAGAEIAGSIRGAEVLLGGAAMLYSGIAAAALRDARQAHEESGQRDAVRLVARRFGSVLALLAANLTIVLLLPDRLGETILGDSWSGAASIAPEASLVLGGAVAFGGVSTAIRASLDMKALVGIDIFGAALTVVIVPVIAQSVGAEAALTANGLVIWTMFLLGVRHLARTVVRPGV